MPKKRCTWCKKPKVLAEFEVRVDNPNLSYKWCNSCRRKKGRFLKDDFFVKGQHLVVI